MSVQTMKSRSEEHEVAREIVDFISKQMFKLGMYFQWYMFQRLPIYFVYSKKKDKTKKIAWTDGYRIYIGKNFLKFFLTLQLNIIRHELYHIVLGHVFQLKNRLRKARSIYERNIIEVVHNVIADAVVNGIIHRENEKLGLKTPVDINEMLVDVNQVNNIIEGDVIKMGFGNAVDKLLFLVKKGIVSIEAYSPEGVRIDLSAKSIGEIISEYGELVVKVVNNRNGSMLEITLVPDQEVNTGPGDDKEDRHGGEEKKILIKKPVGGEPVKPEDIYRMVKEAREFDTRRRIVSDEKFASPDGVDKTEYELMDVGAKKPEWEAKLTHILTSHFSKYAIISWHFVNKRAPFEKPGIRYLSLPDIHILLDVSGSMLDGTLEKALKRIIYIVEKYPDVKVKLYQWSTIASLPQDIDRRFAENIKKYKKIEIQTGGTVIEPVLDMVLKTAKPQDTVVILTDGYIYDIEEKRVISKLGKLSRKTTVIFASLGYIPETLPKTVYRIKLED